MTTQGATQNFQWNSGDDGGMGEFASNYLSMSDMGADMDMFLRDFSTPATNSVTAPSSVPQNAAGSKPQQPYMNPPLGSGANLLGNSSNILPMPQSLSQPHAFGFVQNAAFLARGGFMPNAANLPLQQMMNSGLQGQLQNAMVGGVPSPGGHLVAPKMELEKKNSMTDMTDPSIDDFLSSDDQAPNDRSKRLRSSSYMAADEKAKANRDRNREHARNTRLRKKEYVEKLKQTVQQLGQEKEKAERDKRVSQTKLMEQATLRRQVLQTMFFYRSQMETRRESWATVLDESCQLVMPITPYRSFLSTEVINNSRVIYGIDGFIQDTASFAVLVESIGMRGRGDKRVCVQFYAGPEDTIIVADSVMCRWMMKTENAMECGALCECYNHGMCKATFTPQNKLLHIEMVFDVMSFMQQLQRASGREEFRVVPNTLQMAQQPTEEARAVISMEPPYNVTFANPAFCRLSGYSPEEVQTRTLASLHGPESDPQKVSRFMEGIQSRRATSMETWGYFKDGQRRMCYMRAYPLSMTQDSPEVQLLITVDDCTAGYESSKQAQPGSCK